MRIGEVAARAGVSAATCRYYERYGILPPPVRHGGKRDYDESVVALLALIAFAKRAGLSLSEIRELLRPGAIRDRWREVRTRKLEMLRDVERLVRRQRRTLLATKTCTCTT